MSQKSVVGQNGNVDDISNVVKVASTSRGTAVAGVIAEMMHGNRSAKIQAIGASAVDQTVKALAIARSYLIDGGIDFTCTIEFIDPEIDNQENTAVCFTLNPCLPRHNL